MFVSFTWDVTQTGYQVVELEDGRWLTDGLPGDVRGLKLRKYKPLEEYPSLFREFCDITPDDRGITAFANRYGLLGKTYKVDDSEQQPAIWGKERIGERIDLWEKEIKSMRLAVEAWDALQSEDADGIRRIMQQDPGGPGYLRIVGRHGDYRTLYYPREREVVNLVQLLRWFVQDEVNQSLAWAIETKIQFSDDEGRYRLGWGPSCLLTALWFQFAQTVAENKVHRRCEQCGTWFEVPPDGRRRNSLYCKDACKSKAYRARRASSQIYE